ncbi:hypothetical protein HS088_TW13G00334 [Tripterygium wilfordii]|uniref:Protein BIC1 n=2 Tax=Tripterygium wilfordii TaxID=458696 RepID=A0A7J7CTN3_TRIWF|nr:hypothetical protein HS088_TW13G00334 [Tripterygium wilfordii]
MSDLQNPLKASNPAPSVPVEEANEEAQVSRDGHVKPQSSPLQDIQHECLDKEAASQGKSVDDNVKESHGGWDAVEEDYGRERMKRHRIEVAGRVWIPDIWGQEEVLKDWIDCSAFDACLVPNGIVSARASLVDEGRRINSTGLRIENSC